MPPSNRITTTPHNTPFPHIHTSTDRAARRQRRAQRHTETPRPRRDHTHTHRQHLSHHTRTSLHNNTHDTQHSPRTPQRHDDGADPNPNPTAPLHTTTHDSSHSTHITPHPHNTSPRQRRQQRRWERQTSGPAPYTAPLRDLVRPVRAQHRAGSHRRLAPQTCPPDRTRPPHHTPAASHSRSSSASSDCRRRRRHSPPLTRPTRRVEVPTDWDETFSFESLQLPAAPDPNTVPSIAADIQATPTLAALAAQPPPLPLTHQQWLLAQHSNRAAATATATDPTTAVPRDPRNGDGSDQHDTPVITPATPTSRSNTPTQIVHYAESDNDSDSGDHTAAHRAHQALRDTPGPRGSARTAPLTGAVRGCHRRPTT